MERIQGSTVAEDVAVISPEGNSQKVKGGGGPVIGC